MQLLALTAEFIGYWADKSIMAVGILVTLGYLSSKRGQRHRHQETRRLREQEAEHTADISRAGPPRFNG